jgi:hypothetical protein
MTIIHAPKCKVWHESEDYRRIICNCGAYGNMEPDGQKGSWQCGYIDPESDGRCKEMSEWYILYRPYFEEDEGDGSCSEHLVWFLSSDQEEHRVFHVDNIR